jgi:putative transposase
MQTCGVSERRACRVIGQMRSAQRYKPKPNQYSENLRDRIVALTEEYGRYGYRQVTGLLNGEGWEVGKARVYTIWREEGLKIPQKQPKRGRLWLADGSCIRQRPEYENHVWSYDFVSEKTHDGRPFRILNVIDEYSRKCLATVVARTFRGPDILLALAELFILHGVPKFIRSDNGPEFISRRLRKWFSELEVRPLYIEKGSPWENGYCESFNGKMRYELLNGEIFYTLFEAKVVIEKWRHHYNTKRPHSSLGYRPPAPETLQHKDFKLVG